MSDEKQKASLLEGLKIVHDMLLIGSYPGEYAIQLTQSIHIINQLIDQTNALETIKVRHGQGS